MAQTPLNYFRRVSAKLDSSPTVYYEAPFDRAAIILTALASNTTTSTLTVSLGLSGNNYTVTGKEYFDIVKNFQVPGNDTVNLTIGKLVLEEFDQLLAYSSASGITITFSVLEALNTQ
jgi:hypothetical protein